MTEHRRRSPCAARARPRRAWVAATVLVVAGTGVALFGATRTPPPVIAVSAVGHMPSAIGVDPRSRHVFVSNSADNTVSMLDARTGTVLQTIAVGRSPDQLVVNPRTERVFVMNEGDATVSVLDAVSGTVRATLTHASPPVPVWHVPTSDLLVLDGAAVPSTAPGGLLDSEETRPLMVVADSPQGSTLHPMALPPHGWQTAVDRVSGRLWVATPMRDSISLPAVVRGQPVRTIAVGPAPSAIAVDATTGHTFVVNSGDRSGPPAALGSVSMLDSHSGQMLRTIIVGAHPALLAVDAPAGRVLVVHGWGGPGSRDLGTTSHGTDVLDAQSGRVLGTIATGAVTLEASWTTAHPQLVAVDERRSHAFVLDHAPAELPRPPTAARVSIVDDRRATVLRSFTVAPFSVALAVDATAARLFVLNTYADCHPPIHSWVAWLPSSLRVWLPFVPQEQPSQRLASVTCAAFGSVTVYDLARL